MMPKKDIKDVMGEFSPQAPENMWESVSSKLAENSMIDVREQMADFMPGSGMGHWSAINKRLIMNRFLSFHARRFNVYYLFIMLLFISGTVILATPTSKGKKLYNPQNNPKIAEYYIAPDNIIESENFSQLSQGNPAQELPDEISSDTGNELAGQSVSENQNRVARQLPKQTQNQNTSETQEDFPDVSINNTTQSSTLGNQQNTHAEFSAFEKITFSKMPRLSLFPFNPILADLLIKNYQPLPDTLGIDAFGEPILADSSHWAISFGVFGNRASNTYNLIDNPELLIQNQNPADIFNKQEKPQLGYAADLNLDYINNHLVLSSGIGYQEIRSEFNSNVPTTFVDSLLIWEEFMNEGWLYDTTYYLNIDTLLITGDSVYSPYLDSTWGSFLDSTQVMSYDSTPGTKYINEQSIVRYINIPVWVGYREKFNNWEIQAQLGLITSIPVYNQTSWYNPELNEIVYNKNAPFNNILLTGAFRTYIARRLNDNWLIGVEPSYYYRLNSMFDKNYPIKGNQHLFRFGVRVQYQF